MVILQLYFIVIFLLENKSKSNEKFNLYYFNRN